MFIAFPERLGKYGAVDYLKERMGIMVNLDSRNMCQESRGYRILRVDSRDVPLAVETGALFGITGYDWYQDYFLANQELSPKIVEQLDFGKAEICAFKASGKMRKPAVVVTPYENIAKDYLKKMGITFVDLYGNPGQVTCRRGKTEGWVKSGLADIAIDNKNSGLTQQETGLVMYGKIMDSYAIVISMEENKYKVKEILRL